MSEKRTILYWEQLQDLLDLAEVVITEEGNEYFKIPAWFQKMGHGEFVIHTDNLPEDLSMFICKSGLGGDNPKPIKSEL